MKKKNFLFVLISVTLIFLSLLCTGVEKLNRDDEINNSSGQYTVYVINNSYHTGIIIPVDSESIRIISALKYFNKFQFIEIGWGEEIAYQDPVDNYWHDLKAVILTNPSVIRFEGYKSITERFINWSNYTIELKLSTEQFTKLVEFIDQSFIKENNEPISTSKRQSGEVIFFKSVYTYHLFNTCNTWVAKALKNSGLEVSPFFVITAGQLYNKIKNQGRVLKTPE